jgi:ubiquitin-protein ligase
MTTQPCPLCFVHINDDEIDAHVNACLDTANDDGVVGVADSTDGPSADELLAIALQEEENQHTVSSSSDSKATPTRCVVCNEAVSDSSTLFIIDECFHKTHRFCAASFVRSRIAAAVHVTCPVAGCATQLSVRDLKQLVADSAPSSSASSRRVRHDATQRLMAELELIAKADPQTNGFSVEPIDDDLFHWEIRFFGFDSTEPLAHDLARVRDHCVTLEATFPPDFPFAPPFIRVIRPRFHYRSGHITLGGSCCMELLTRSGWSACNTIEAVLISIRTNLIVGGARVDHKKPDYTLAEAREAFDRMVQTHGW